MTLEEYLHRRYTAETVKAYKREIEIYQSNFKQAQQADYQAIVHYLGLLRNRYHNPRTISRILASIKAYYDFLSSSGKRKDNPAKSILLRDKQHRSIQLQDLFSKEETEPLLNRKERYPTLESRNKVLMSLLIYQGLTPYEIVVLKLGDINLREASIYIKPTSSNNSRTLGLKPRQILLFHRYEKEIRPKLLKGALTDIFLIGHRGNPMNTDDISKHVIRSFKGLYAPRKVNCQTLRQSVLTQLLKAGNDLRVVQVFAGHKNPSTTEKYKQSDVEALKGAIQNYHPLK